MRGEADILIRKYMIVFISPAKGFFNRENFSSSDNFDFIDSLITRPRYIKKTRTIINRLKKLSIEDISSLMKINYDLSKLNFDRIKDFDFSDNGLPALFAYSGIQYKNIDANSLDVKSLEYASKHLRIMSGLYGVLRPFDSIFPYRLELLTRLKIDDYKNLYEFWGDTYFESLKSDCSGVIVNLASDEYSKAVKKYLPKEIIYISCSFKSIKNGQLKSFSTSSKIARGKMTRFILENRIENYKDLKKFGGKEYHFSKEHSNEIGNVLEYTFIID